MTTQKLDTELVEWEMLFREAIFECGLSIDEVKSFLSSYSNTSNS